MILEVCVDECETIRLALENPEELPVALEKLAAAVRKHGWRGTMDVMEANGCKVSFEPLGIKVASQTAASPS